jgi:uncharacterized membrane protein affecting hemolysin expression
MATKATNSRKKTPTKSRTPAKKPAVSVKEDPKVKKTGVFRESRVIISFCIVAIMFIIIVLQGKEISGIKNSTDINRTLIAQTDDKVAANVSKILTISSDIEKLKKRSAFAVKKKE